MFTADIQALLNQFRFDSERFEAQRRRLQQDGFSPDMARIKGPVVPLERGAYVDPGEAHRAEGEAAIAAASVAVLLLNGGMATRFGGVAKGAATALDDQSFLCLRMSQARAVATSLGARIPCVLMNSFATDAATSAHLEANRYFGFDPADVYTCVQGISVRLTERGEIFYDDSGAPSLYTPGHGDLPWTLSVSGTAEKLRARGVRTIFVSNVDNLGSGLDSAILGAHLASGRMLSVETVDPNPHDVGGAPFYVDGKLQLLEGFRLPRDLDPSTLTGFNVNSFYFQWPALDPDIPLGFYPVQKTVDGRKAIQFERIVGEVSAHVPTTYLRVPRDLAHGRFLPVKTPEDLVALQPTLRARYAPTAARA